MADEALSEAWLEAAARTFRSKIAFENNLKLKCMDCIIENARLLRRNRATRSQFACFPLVLRHGLIKRLEVVSEEQSSDWTNAKSRRVFSMLKLLLDASVAEFDFKVFGSSVWAKNRKVWNLLSKRCPDLKGVVDDRESHEPVPLGPILPLLLKLRRVEHIRLKFHECSVQELGRLLETLPDLRSLAVSVGFWQLGRDVLAKLVSMHKLESLWIRLREPSADPEWVSSWEFQEEMMAECLQHMPGLRKVNINSWHLFKDSVAHNSKPFALQRPLALRTLRVNDTLKGWSCEQLPHVTNLHLEGRLENVNEFLGFANLTVLRCETDGADAMKIVRRCSGKLQELKLYINDEAPIDLQELFFLCPKLRLLGLMGCVSHGGNPFVHPVSAANFKHLRSVKIWFSGGVPSILTEMLRAPCLEKFDVRDFLLEPDRIYELSVQLLSRRDMLQHLKEFIMDVPAEHLVAGRAHFVLFVKLLVAVAPRLRQILLLDHHPDAADLDPLKSLYVPGLEIRVV